MSSECVMVARSSASYKPLVARAVPPTSSEPLKAQGGTGQSIINITTAPASPVPGAMLNMVPISSTKGKLSSSY